MNWETVTPTWSKSFTFRVTTVRSCSRAVAAIRPSANIQRTTRKLSLCVQYPPTLGNGSCDRESSPGKQDRKIAFNPRFEFRFPLPGRQQGDSFAEFAKTHGANKQRLKDLCGNPRFNSRLRSGTHQLGWNVGVHQEAAHSRSTGREKEDVRQKTVSISSSVSKPRTLAHASINSWPERGWGDGGVTET